MRSGSDMDAFLIAYWKNHLRVLQGSVLSQTHALLTAPTKSRVHTGHAHTVHGSFASVDKRETLQKFPCGRHSIRALTGDDKRLTWQGCACTHVGQQTCRAQRGKRTRVPPRHGFWSCSRRPGRQCSRAHAEQCALLPPRRPRAAPRRAAWPQRPARARRVSMLRHGAPHAPLDSRPACSRAGGQTSRGQANTSTHVEAGSCTGLCAAQQGCTTWQEFWGGDALLWHEIRVAKRRARLEAGQEAQVRVAVPGGPARAHLAVRVHRTARHRRVAHPPRHLPSHRPKALRSTPVRAVRGSGCRLPPPCTCAMPLWPRRPEPFGTRISVPISASRLTQALK